jgi:hypothetical protein
MAVLTSALDFQTLNEVKRVQDRLSDLIAKLKEEAVSIRNENMQERNRLAIMLGSNKPSFDG